MYFIRYYDCFIQENVTPEFLPYLTEKHLFGIGVENKDHRKVCFDLKICF